MMSFLNCVLVSYCLTITSAIRVDWNTNTGPIIPPTHRTTHAPLPPFREPAQVWEKYSADIPNPNPYIYIAPPPSRPKQRLHTKVDYSSINHNDNNNKYGVVIQPSNIVNAAGKQQQTAAKATSTITVNSLSAKYIPNVGRKYAAVIPKIYNNSNNNNNYDDDNESPLYKWQGKYNVKAKKYKAYEKVKYKPQNYYGKLQSETDTNIKVDNDNHDKNQDDNKRNDHDTRKFKAAEITFELPQTNGEWLQVTEKDEQLQKQQQHQQQQQQLQQWQQQQQQQKQYEYHQYQQLPQKTAKILWKSKKFAKPNNKITTSEDVPMEATFKAITTKMITAMPNSEPNEVIVTAATTATSIAATETETATATESATTTTTTTATAASTEEQSSRMLKKIAYYKDAPLSFKSKKFFSKSKWGIK